MAINLVSSKRIDWARPDGCPSGFDTDYVVVGNSDGGGMALEVAVTSWTKSEPPTREELTQLHKIRLNKRAQPVVLVVETPQGTLVFGPNTAFAPMGPHSADQVQRVVQAALDEPTALAARARLTGLVQALDSTSMPGVKNSGSFANHELRVGVPQLSDWADACARSKALLLLKGQQLIEKLGFKAGRAGAHALLLTGGGPRAEAIAVMLVDVKELLKSQVTPLTTGRDRERREREKQRKEFYETRSQLDQVRNRVNSGSEKWRKKLGPQNLK